MRGKLLLLPQPGVLLWSLRIGLHTGKGKSKSPLPGPTQSLPVRLRREIQEPSAKTKSWLKNNQKVELTVTNIYERIRLTLATFMIMQS